jgi:hypothetical protein
MMKDGKNYRQYAADCRRIAKAMSAADREKLLDMAEAWERRALEAERKDASTGKESNDGK